jgi:branched-chain amino acid transport system permease protein
MLTSQLVWNTLITGSVYALITVGFALTYNIGGFFNMAHGAMFLVGAYTGYIIYRILGLGFPLALACSALAAGTLGLALHYWVFDLLNRRKAPGLTLFITSLGILIVVEGLVAVVFGNEVIVFSPGPSPALDLFGGRITALQLNILVLTVLTFVCSYLFFKKTNLGRRVRAVSDDRELAKAVGLPVPTVLSTVFFYGSTLAGVAGTLVGFEQSIGPGSGMKAILAAMVASIIGGTGSFTGPILGAFFLGFLENVSVAFFPSEWKNSIVFSIMILFFFTRPAGFLGVKR